VYSIEGPLGQHADFVVDWKGIILESTPEANEIRQHVPDLVVDWLNLLHGQIGGFHSDAPFPACRTIQPPTKSV
jgi:hypothetical protein